MQKGMNQTVAWLAAVFSASVVFSIGAFMVSKYKPKALEQHMSAKEFEPLEKVQKGRNPVHEKKKASEVKQIKAKQKSAETGGEILRPDDMHH